MKVLIIGFGSIGKRHYQILSSIDIVSKIDIVTKQNLNHLCTFRRLKNVNNLNDYDYFVIASETYLHYEHLNFICSEVKNKIILVEKPLFDKNYQNINIHRNNIFVAYNLRFHPIIIKLKEMIKEQKVYYINVVCGQYLPSWRPGQDYRKSYSADISKGGGVLRDLSHELDYISWLFGDFVKLDYINTKISELEINSDDIFTGIGLTNENCIINITLDYISKTPIRQLIIHCEGQTIFADMIRNEITISKSHSEQVTFTIEKNDRDYTYMQMHKVLLEKSYENLCDFNHGLKIVDIIDNIDYKEL